MKPTRLQFSNVARFPVVDLTFDSGTCAIQGSNGSGKSTLLAAVEAALFADGSRDLAPMLGPLSDRLELTLEFDHAGERYRVRRGYRSGASAKATLDFERLDEAVTVIREAELISVSAEGGLGFETRRSDHWLPLTLATAKETQAELERITGLNRRTFGASSYLAQGDAGNFTEASPADRKAILSDVLDPRGYWPAVAAKAAEERKQAERALEADRVRIGEREELTAGLGGLVDAEVGARLVQRSALEEFTRADENYQGAQAALAANAAAVERLKAATAAHEEAQRERNRAHDALETARNQAELLEPARVELAETEAQAGRVAEVELALSIQRETVAASQASKLKRRSADLEAEEATREWRRVAAEAVTLEQRHGELADRLAHLRQAVPDTEHCETCHQLLGVEAREATIATIGEELARLVGQIAQAELLRDEAELARMSKEAAAHAIVVTDVTVLEDLERPLARARAAAERLSGLRERIGVLDAHAHRISHLTDDLAYAEALREARAAESARVAAETQDDTELHQAAESARDSQRQARAALDEANAQVTRLEEQLQRVQTAVYELEELRRATIAKQDELDLLRLAEKAFGRDGIPTLIVENTLAQIEANANGYLAMMPTTDGTTLRVQLETQRAQKTTEHLRETLDVVVADTDGPRPYETYSGGERARVNIALRLALAILLADRRGAESRLLCIDEIEGLDAEGQAQLVRVIQSVQSRFDVIVIASHYGGIRDAFDRTLVVSKTDGVSRLVTA